MIRVQGFLYFDQDGLVGKIEDFCKQKLLTKDKIISINQGRDNNEVWYAFINYEE